MFVFTSILVVAALVACCYVVGIAIAALCALLLYKPGT